MRGSVGQVYGATRSQRSGGSAGTRSGKTAVSQNFAEISVFE